MLRMSNGVIVVVESLGVAGDTRLMYPVSFPVDERRSEVRYIVQSETRAQSIARRQGGWYGSVGCVDGAITMYCIAQGRWVVYEPLVSCRYDGLEGAIEEARALEKRQAALAKLTPEERAILGV